MRWHGNCQKTPTIYYGLYDSCFLKVDLYFILIKLSVLGHYSQHPAHNKPEGRFYCNTCVAVYNRKIDILQAEEAAEQHFLVSNKPLLARRVAAKTSCYTITQRFIYRPLCT